MQRREYAMYLWVDTYLDLFVIISLEVWVDEMAQGEARFYLLTLYALRGVEFCSLTLYLALRVCHFELGN